MVKVLRFPEYPVIKIKPVRADEYDVPVGKFCASHGFTIDKSPVGAGMVFKHVEAVDIFFYCCMKP